MIPKPNRGRAGSALHNFGHSFVSLMNFEDDYVMSILVRTAERTGLRSFGFDVLGDRLEPGVGSGKSGTTSSGKYGTREHPC